MNGYEWNGRYFVQYVEKSLLLLACVAGVEKEGKGKPQRAKHVSKGSLLLSSQYFHGGVDPFPPFLQPAPHAMLLLSLNSLA